MRIYGLLTSSTSLKGMGEVRIFNFSPLNVNPDTNFIVLYFRKSYFSHDATIIVLPVVCQKVSNEVLLLSFK